MSINILIIVLNFRVLADSVHMAEEKSLTREEASLILVYILLEDFDYGSYCPVFQWCF